MSKVFNPKIYDEYIDKDDLPSSLAKVEEMIRNKSSDSKLLDVKAEILNLMDRIEEAISIYENIIQIDNSYINAYIALSNLYLAKEIKEDKNYSALIVGILKRAEQINPDEISYYVLAGALKDNGQLDEAIKYYRKALKQKKGDNYFLENIWVEFGRIYTEQKKYTLSLDAYDNAIHFSVKENGDDSHCSEVYVAKREIYSILGSENKVREMDEQFASAENKYKERPPHIYHGKIGKKFQDISNRLQKLGKQDEERRQQLFEAISPYIKEAFPDNMPSHKDLGEIIDFALDELDYDGTLFNKEERALEKAHLAKLFNENYV